MGLKTSDYERLNGSARTGDISTVQGLSEPVSVEPILSRVKAQERNRDWRGAAESCEIALGLVPVQNTSIMAQLHERSGYALYCAALQAKTLEEFAERMRKSVANYERAQVEYDSIGSQRTPEGLRCSSMIAYVSYWLAPDCMVKKQFLSEAWTLSREALKAFREAGKSLEYAKTYNQLGKCPSILSSFESSFHGQEKIFREAVNCGEQAVGLLSTLNEPDELAKAYVLTAINLASFALLVAEVAEQGDQTEKALAYWGKGRQLSEEVALLQLAEHPVGPGILSEGSQEAFDTLRGSLGYQESTGDNFIAGNALDWLAYHSIWKFEGVEDPDEALRFAEKALQYAKEARDRFSLISYTSSRIHFWIESPYPDYYFCLARVEVDIGKKRDLLQKARGLSFDLLRKAKNSGYPAMLHYAQHVSSKILASLANVEQNPQNRRLLLEEALSERNESVRGIEKTGPYEYWNRGIMQNSLAEIKQQLAQLAEDPQTREQMLKEAEAGKEAALKLCMGYLPMMIRWGLTSNIALLGRLLSEHGDLLLRLHELTKQREDLRKAIRVFLNSAEYYGKSGISSRIAECHWKAARAQDALEEHFDASGNFLIAARNYKTASEKIAQLRKFYEDLAFYMEAWSELEKARHHHNRQEHREASQHYEKAAWLHKSTTQWKYLEQNYSAWAQLDNAEDLSRTEKNQDAINAFQESAKLFKESREAIDGELLKVEDLYEKQMATRIVNATDSKLEYCNARVALEQARILDKNGDHSGSSERYGKAAEAFERLFDSLDSERDRIEIKLLETLSRAWEIMSEAEAKVSPKLYSRASQLFEEAKDLGLSEQVKMMALGHSRFCSALENGSRFVDSRNPAFYEKAKEHLESAANYYLQAGYQNASEYAQGSTLLFDAYAHLDRANRETEPDKKAKLYMMTERILQSSGEHYEKAGYAAKKSHVLRLLERAKKDRELAVLLSEVLKAPSIIPTTAVFQTPGSSHESAVGVERFEDADIRSSLAVGKRNLKVGEELAIEIDFVNAGRGPAQLIKIEELVPEGFEVTRRPESYRVEDNLLYMKGKRLDALKTEEVKLAFRPKVKGQFILKPRILYLDGSGRNKIHEPEPIEIRVEELGISGWLKGR